MTAPVVTAPAVTAVPAVSALPAISGDLAMTAGARTKERILRAASAEFAAFGFAGARIDRIADAAGANKERIYAHIGDKRALFGAVIAANLLALADHMALDARDLPESAGRIFDHLTAHPQHLRILDWGRLEGVDDLVEKAELRDPERPLRIEAVERAQSAGFVRPDMSPGDVVIAIFAVATTWMQAPLHLRDVDDLPQPGRRAFVVDAVRRLLTP